MVNHLTRKTEDRAVDILNLIAGAVLLLSPWLFGFAGESLAAWSAWISAAVITIVAIGALVAFERWQEWVNLAAGIWTAIAPWALGFANLGNAATAHVILGAIVAIAAAVELWKIHNRPLSAA